MDTDQLLRILNTHQSELGLAGLGYAVLKDGTPLLTGGLGWVDAVAVEKMPVTEQTRFPIASCTKAFTGLALHLLKDSGILDLERPVQQYLPEFQLHDEIASADITPADLLCHRSGLPPHTWSWVYSEQSREDFIRDRLPHLLPCCSYRDHYQYSNLMYAVAGQLVEALTRSDWEHYIQQHILDPLQMHHTAFLDEHWAHTPQLARPHQQCGNGWQVLAPFYARTNHLIAPASEMLSTPRDMMVWMASHTEELGAFLSPRGFQQFCEPRIMITDDRPHPALGPLSYAYGWRHETFRGRPHLWHTGGCSGYSAVASFLPQEGHALCLLANTHATTDSLRAMVYEIYDLMLEETSPGWAAVLTSTDSPVHEDTVSTSAELPAERRPPPGRYAEPGYGTLEVETDGIRVRFNACNNARMEAGKTGEPELVLPDYQVRFPVMIHAPTHGQPVLDIPFEPEVPPIRFRWEAG